MSANCLPLTFLDDTGSSSAFLRRAFVGLALAITAGAIGGDRVNCASRTLARNCQYGRNVRRVSSLERRERRQRVALLLRFPESLAVNQMRLHVCAHKLDGTRHQRLHRVRDIMRLVKHVDRGEVLNALQLGVNQLIENQKELEGLDGARVQIIVAVLAIVKMEARQLAELYETRDDHLYVDVRRMMAQINQRESLWPKLARAVIADSPIIDDRRIERWLVELMLDKQAPVIGDMVVNLAHAFKVAFESATKMLLARKVSAIANPDRVRPGA